MKLSEFDYNLPKKYIAQIPAEPRDSSKLMVLDRAAGKIEHRHFYDIGKYLQKGDILVVNNSKVMAARLFGRKSTGARVEVLLLNNISKDENIGLFKQESKTWGTMSSRNDANINPPALTLRLKNNKNFLENGTINIRKIKNGQGEVGRGAEFTRKKFHSKNIWQVLVRPAKRLQAGDEVVIDVSGGQERDNREKDMHRKIPPSPPFDKLPATSDRTGRAGSSKKGGIKMKIIKELEEGIRLVEFDKDITKDLDTIGMVPLPPYIKSDDANIFKKRYQTVYAKVIGSAAAPTAGLHFTPKLIKNLKDKGVEFREVTLHAGLDTFRPIMEENIEDHKIHKEYCELDEKVAKELNNARKNGNRIIVAGTTATRVLESACDGKGRWAAFSGWTDKFIYPGYKFSSIDALITNFHLPKSSLLLMASAFCGDKEHGKRLIFKAYDEAKRRKYRFFSFGDAMLII